MPQLTIEFRGLCLFALSPDKERFHVFLAQPKGHAHRLVRQFEQGANVITEELPIGSSLEHGVATGQQLTMPGEDEMANISGMPGCKPLPEAEAVADPKGARGSHMILHGGSLTVRDKVGVWEIANAPTKEYSFPYLVEWSGEAGPGDLTGVVRIWNASPEETPDPGTNSPDPNISQSLQLQQAKAAMHFQAYFDILKVAGHTIKFKHEKLAKVKAEALVTTLTDVNSVAAHELGLGHGFPFTIIVASCPSAQISLI